MNRNEYAKNLEIKNRRLLLKIYQREVQKLKIKIYEATEKGNDTTYLEKLHNDVEKEVVTFKKYLKQYSVKSATDSYKGGAKLALLGVSANEVMNKFEFGKANREAIQILARTTYEPLSKMAQHIGRATLEYMQRENFENTQSVLKALGKLADSEFLRKTGIEGVADVVVGSSSWQKAARDIRDKIIKDADFKVPYYKKNGDLSRFVQAKDYAKMVSRTTTANIMREGAKDSILDTFDGEFDLVEILGHSVFPNSPCIPYQGQILSLEGIVKGYPTVAEAEANGLFHPNCIHSFGVTDAVMDIYRNDEYEVNEGAKEEETQEGIREETTEKNSAVVKDINVPSKIQEIEDKLKEYENQRQPINNDLTYNSLKNKIDSVEVTDEMKKYNRFVRGEDVRTKALLSDTDYMEKPQVLNPKDFDKLDNESYIKVFRGVNDTENKTAAVINEEYRSGKAYIGQGLYGGGTYTTPHLQTAQGFGKDDVIEIAFSKNARIINYRDLDIKKSEFIKDVNKPLSNISFIKKDLLLNKSNIAKEMGYDIIQVDFSEWRLWAGNVEENLKALGEDYKSPYYVILNRKITIAKAKE